MIIYVTNGQYQISRVFFIYKEICSRRPFIFNQTKTYFNCRNYICIQPIQTNVICIQFIQVQVIEELIQYEFFNFVLNIIIQSFCFMQCPTCFLRYNTKLRQPKVISCGHTICQNCIKKTDKCRICGTQLIPDKNYALNFSLMQIIEKDSKQIDKYVKVCFVGSSTTGKTSLIKRMMGSQFCQETVTTIGYDFSFQDRMIDNLQIRYQLWDSAGQQKYRAISPIHYKNADIAVIVYDIAQSASDNKISYWIQQAMKNCSQDVRFIIIGNKIDLAEQNKMFKPIDQKGWNLIQQNHYIHIELSCKTFFGIKQFWETLDQQFRKKLSSKKKNIVFYEKQLQDIQKKRETMTKIKKNTKIDRNHFHTQNRNDSCC